MFAFIDGDRTVFCGFDNTVVNDRMLLTWRYFYAIVKTLFIVKEAFS